MEFKKEIAELPKIHNARIAYDPTKGDHVPFSYTFWSADGRVNDRVHGVLRRSISGLPYIEIEQGDIIIRALNESGRALYHNFGILYTAEMKSMDMAIRKGVVFIHRLHMSTPRNRAYYHHQH